MAPQLIFEEKPIYSIKCDVWSIGVVMYYVKRILSRFYSDVYLGTPTKT